MVQKHVISPLRGQLQNRIPPAHDSGAFTPRDAARSNHETYPAVRDAADVLFANSARCLRRRDSCRKMRRREVGLAGADYDEEAVALRQGWSHAG
jgi:hypothetical protein